MKNPQIKRIIKYPENIRCRKCKSDMKYVMYPGPESSIEEFFVCLNEKCGKQSRINRVKIKKEKPINSVVVYEPKINPEDVAFSLTQYKMRDDYYILENGEMYNPILRKKLKGEEEIIVTDEEHQRLISNIFNA
jgi:phage FluMu protein Com